MAAKVGKKKGKITTEEWAGRKAWAKYSGNTMEPDVLEEHGQEHDLDATGLKWMLNKPPAWQNLNPETEASDNSDDETVNATNPHAFRNQMSMNPSDRGLTDKIGRNRAQSSSKKMPITDFLRSIPTFQSVDTDDIAKLESGCSLQIFGNGSTILNHDTTSDFIYVIREGNVKVMKKKQYRSGHPSSEKVMNLTQGDYFGEGSFTNRSTASQQSYVADGDVLCISIPFDTYESIFTGGSQLIGTTLTIDASNNEEVST